MRLPELRQTTAEATEHWGRALTRYRSMACLIMNNTCSVASLCLIFTTTWTAVHQASCSSLSPRVSSNSCPSSRWYHPTISSSVTLFSCWLQSSSASGSFPVSQLFASGGQTIGALASVLPVSIQGWFPLGLTGLIPLQSKGLSRVLQESSPAPQLKSIIHIGFYRWISQ